jgi:hypothetical protein
MMFNFAHLGGANGVRDEGDYFQFFSPLDLLTESPFEKRIMVLPFSVFSTSEGTLSVAKSLGFGTSSWSL